MLYFRKDYQILRVCKKDIEQHNITLLKISNGIL